MEKEEIARINELARKAKAEGLTEVEAAEQKVLRKRYLAEFREGMIATMESFRVAQEDGSSIPLWKKPEGVDATPRTLRVEPLDAEDEA